jgi:hypothetical protein
LSSKKAKVNQFGKKIRHHRELNGFLQRFVARKLSIDAPMLCKMLEDPELRNQPIDGVYQFNRMYWKSVSQQNIPVTIKYPEMVAVIFPHSQYDKLPDYGKENLWFL